MPSGIPDREWPRPRLSEQQRKLVKGLLKGKTISQAALDAGYSENCPSQVGSQALAAIREKMPELMDRIGLTQYKLLRKYLIPALEAEDTEFAKYEGKITDSCKVAAWGPRLTALDMAFNLRGSYAPKETKHEGEPLAVQFVTNVSFGGENG